MEPATSPGVDEQATLAEPAATSRKLERSSGRLSDLPSGESTGSRITSVITPRETLHLQEINRTRIFTVMVVALSAFVLATLTVVGGDPVSKRVFALALAGIGASCGWLRWELRRDEGYTVERATAVAYISIVCAFTGIWFFGVFSPAPMILPFGIAFFSIGQSARAVFAVYVTCALLQLALTVAVAVGVLPDAGMIRTVGLNHLEQGVFIVLMQAVLLVTYVLQRKTREATLSAIEEHDRVVRSLAHRDALLAEARQDLAQAMQAGGIGRWTEEVLGSFRLGRVLGRGAMGEVYDAVHVTTGDPAAVKLLHPHVLAQAELVQRFVREARIVAALTTPNIVRVLEVSPPEARVPYLAMERLVGQDLTDYLREHKRMGLRAVLTMIRQVGVGLDAARAAGVVHRDLKPRNLFFAEQGTQQVWKILDFGVARLAGEETLTVDQIVGTPNYMAPEQANGEPVTHRSDLFALGIIAYRTLTGRPAFEGENTAEILYKVVHTMPPRPTRVAPVPAELDLVLAIALAKSPDDRFDSASELANALEGAARGRLDANVRARAQRILAKLPWADA
jgi:serine/threonine-protein kinase